MSSDGRTSLVFQITQYTLRINSDYSIIPSPIRWYLWSACRMAQIKDISFVRLLVRGWINDTWGPVFNAGDGLLPVWTSYTLLNTPKN